MHLQQGDVLLFQTPNGGDIDIHHGQVAMTATRETAVYLSLFGGNEQDNGLTDSKQWWGNLGEDGSYRSETQYLLKNIPATSANLRRIEDAATRDLKWCDASVSASIPAINTIQIDIDIEGEQYSLTEVWSDND